MRLYGKNSALERLKANPRSIKKIIVQEGIPDASYIRKKAQKWGITVITVPKSKIIKLAQNLNTQGILVEVEDFAYVPYDELLETALKKKWTLLFLDNLNDPQNLGAIIRSVAGLGDFALVLPTHRSVEVTPAVLRVSSGGDNYVSIAKVPNLNNALKAAREAGFFIAGAVTEGGQDLMETQFSFPVALVIGSEQKGIREVVKNQLDLGVTIPMAQPRLSFNVAHAAAMFCYEIAKQKKHSNQ